MTSKLIFNTQQCVKMIDRKSTRRSNTQLQNFLWTRQEQIIQQNAAPPVLRPFVFLAISYCCCDKRQHTLFLYLRILALTILVACFRVRVVFRTYYFP